MITIIPVRKSYIRTHIKDVIVYNGTVIIKTTPERREKIAKIISNSRRDYILPKREKNIIVGTLNILSSFAEKYPNIITDYGIDAMEIGNVKNDIIRLMGIPPQHYVTAYYIQTGKKSIKADDIFTMMILKFIFELSDIPHTIKHSGRKIYFTPSNLPRVKIDEAVHRYMFEENCKLINKTTLLSDPIFYPRAEFVKIKYDDIDVIECRSLHIITRDGFYFEKNRKYADMIIDIIGIENYNWLIKSW